jgi:hypothetical protein
MPACQGRYFSVVHSFTESTGGAIPLYPEGIYRCVLPSRDAAMVPADRQFDELLLLPQEFGDNVSQIAITVRLISTDRRSECESQIRRSLCELNLRHLTVPFGADSLENSLPANSCLTASFGFSRA